MPTPLPPLASDLPTWLPANEWRDMLEFAAARGRAGAAPGRIGRELWESLLAHHPAVPLTALYGVVAHAVPDWRRRAAHQAPSRPKEFAAESR